MDECFVVGLSDKYPNELNAGETTYETVGIVPLYQNEFLSQNNQVITVSSNATRSAGLHPLEIDVQRSYQLKRQNQLARLSNSVIQALPNNYKVTVDGTVHPVKVGDVIFNNTGLEVPEDEQQDSELADPSQIPLTVQFCGQADKVDDAVEDTSSDEEREALRPVYDHEPDPEAPCSPINHTDMTNKCYMCFKKFRQKKNLYAHIRKIHSSQPHIQGGIICPLCKMHTLRQEHLRNHLEALHQEQIVKEERQFSTMQEFEAWKEYVEKETFSYFISKSSTKLLASNQTKSYYKCHRSGTCGLEKRPKKTALKKQTSYKIGATCPASMEVVENADGVTVVFWATHVGHNLISKTDGSRFMGLFNSGMSWDNILDQMQHKSTDSAKRQPQPADNSNQTKYVLMDKKIVSLGRKPKRNRLMRSVSQPLLIEKAQHLLNALETTEITAAYRPIISTMIDNLTSVVKRRAIGNAGEKPAKKRKRNIPKLPNTKGNEKTKS